jgi:RNA polymerase sigma-70 factor, ECF subfamily
MDENLLIQSAKKGDLDAFNELVLTYQDLVYHRALTLMGEPESAEDAAQDAFLSAFRNLSGFRGGSFKAWLVRIVSNACYDELRRRKNRTPLSLETVNSEGEEYDSGNWMIDPGASPEEQLERSEQRLHLQAALDRLPPYFRDSVIMVDVFEMDYAEAAAALGVPRGTLQSRLSRGRRHLAAMLREDQSWRSLPLGALPAA